MFAGLLTLTLLGTADPGRCRPTPAPPGVVLCVARSGRLAPARGPAPTEPRRRSRSYLDPQDDWDEEGARKAHPLAGLPSVALAVPRPVLAPRLACRLASRPAVARLIYVLCTLLL